MPWPRWHRLLPRLLPRLCPTCRKIKDERERSLAHLPEGAAKVTLCRVWLCGVCGVFVVLLSRLSLSPHAKNTTHTTEPHTTQCHLCCTFGEMRERSLPLVFYFTVAGRCLQPFQFIWWDVWVIAHMALA